MKIGRVYKIVSGQGNEVYIGSTFNELKYRLRGHKSDYNNWQKGVRGKNCSSFDMFDKYGVNNCKIILIKEYDCCDRKHLEMYESLWILKLKSINKHTPFGEKNFRFLREFKKRREYDENREKYLLNFKLYRDNNKEKLLQQKKVYYNENKEIIKQRTREYREKNKEKIKEKEKEKITCECGLEITKKALSRHIKTKKHKDYILKEK